MSKDLQQAGLEKSHAEAIALAVKQGQGDLATKQDIALLKSEIGRLRTEIKSEIGRLRTELRSDNVWLKWALGVNLALTIGIFAVIISGTITLTLAP